MLSLLLTLFISLFSIGSPINTIDEPKENEIVLQESKPVNNAFVVNGYDMYIGLSEFGDFNYYRSFMDVIKEQNPIFSSNISFSDFVNGTPLDVSVVFKCGNMDNGVFNYTWTINRLRVTLDTSRSQEDRILWEFFESGGALFNLESRYIYFDALKLDCIMNNTRIINGSATTGWMNLCFVYNIYDYRKLLPVDYNDMNYSEGYNNGFYTGYSTGYDDGYNYGKGIGYQSGYTTATNDFENYDDTALTIFNGIFDVGLLPVNVFLTIFDFELFGVNISGVISGLLTLSVVIIIIRLLIGGKKDD